MLDRSDGRGTVFTWAHLFVAASWMKDAACTESDVDLWFPGKGGKQPEVAAAGKRVCAACLVRVECLRYAIHEGIDAGTWGGMTAAERRALSARVDNGKADIGEAA